MDKEVLKLALEALLRSKKAVSGDLDLASCAYGSNDPDGHRYTDAKKALSTLKKAITAIKQALAAPVQPVAQWQKRHPARTNGKWENTDEHDAKWWRDKAQGWEIRALYTTPPAAAQQEPVAWLYPEGLEALKAGKCWTAYGTKQDDNCNIPVHLNAAVAPKIKPTKAECDGFDSHPAAQTAVPDAMTSADIQEHIEYVAGWNDCRQAMLEMMK